jgi:nitroimidazol reductase NimA-like FMN-containing flavoprotein (pyridoxamine 5'-phosphate oxidase superfamily)
MADAWLDELSYDECLALLRAHDIGRISLNTEGWPVVFPVNYRLVEAGDRVWIALRTRPGNVIERAPLKVGFEIDGIDPYHQHGWSVLARGTLHHIDSESPENREVFDSHPWILNERDSWLRIDAFIVSGRRLHAAEPEWAFHWSAYL